MPLLPEGYTEAGSDPSGLANPFAMMAPLYTVAKDVPRRLLPAIAKAFKSIPSAIRRKMKLTGGGKDLAIRSERGTKTGEGFLKLPDESVGAYFHPETAEHAGKRAIVMGDEMLGSTQSRVLEHVKEEAAHATQVGKRGAQGVPNVPESIVFDTGKGKYSALAKILDTPGDRMQKIRMWLLDSGYKPADLPTELGAKLARGKGPNSQFTEREFKNFQKWLRTLAKDYKRADKVVGRQKEAMRKAIPELRNRPLSKDDLRLLNAYMGG